jgi:hypothetical protein
MAITLIIEDGSIVPNANTFVSLADARTKSEALGLVISTDDETANAQLTQGYYQLKRSYQNRLKGNLVSKEQTGVMPRYNMEANGFYIESDEIPEDFINAQLAYADSINKGNSVNNTAKTQEVSSESLDGVGSRTYKDGSSARTTPLVPAVTQWLQPYMKSNGLNRDDYFYDGLGTGCYGGRYVS